MGLVVRAPAKINWTLRVLGRREDGYHEIESLVLAVTLYDELAFSPRGDGRFVLTCDDPGLPTDDGNLICRAAAVMASEVSGQVGLNCRLTKRIPVGGGLGGGSSDGAAALMALNRLWSLDWPKERLMAAAARLGSDVPFFMAGGPAVIRGRGERVEPARLAWHGWIVLMLPDLAVSTAEVYRAWRAEQTAAAVREAAIGNGPVPPAVGWMKRAYNMLEQPAMAVCPAVGKLMARAAELLGRPVRMSGSGSTLFTAYDTEIEARQWSTIISRELQLRTYVVQPVECT